MITSSVHAALGRLKVLQKDLNTLKVGCTLGVSGAAGGAGTSSVALNLVAALGFRTLANFSICVVSFGWHPNVVIPSITLSPGSIDRVELFNMMEHRLDLGFSHATFTPGHDERYTEILTVFKSLFDLVIVDFPVHIYPESLSRLVDEMFIVAQRKDFPSVAKIPTGTNFHLIENKHRPSNITNSTNSVYAPLGVSEPLACLPYDSSLLKVSSTGFENGDGIVPSLYACYDLTKFVVDKLVENVAKLLDVPLTHVAGKGFIWFAGAALPSSAAAEQLTKAVRRRLRWHWQLSANHDLSQWFLNTLGDNGCEVAATLVSDAEYLTIVDLEKIVRAVPSIL